MTYRDITKFHIFSILDIFRTLFFVFRENETALLYKSWGLDGHCVAEFEFAIRYELSLRGTELLRNQKCSRFSISIIKHNIHYLV